MSEPFFAEETTGGRFVILRHEIKPSGGRKSHWDWMFEQGSVLKTFACETWPDTEAVEAIVLNDHRLAYLTYEGPVSGDRGVVQRVASGTFTVLSGPSEQEPDLWRLLLESETLSGRLKLKNEDSRWHITLVMR